MSRRTRAALLLLCLTVLGCEGALQIHVVTAMARPPAHVTLLCGVEDPSGPVVGLGRESFTVLEDGEPVRSWELGQPNLEGRLHMLLLLDYGGTLSDSAKLNMGAAARVFADVLKGSGKLAIYVFDGSPTPQQIAPFADTVPEEAFQALDTFQPRDQSVDLHGAYAAAYDELARALGAESIGAGALVLVSRGPDRAARVGQRDVEKRIDASQVRVPRFAVGIGPDAKNAPLAALSTVAPSYVEETLDLAKALFAIGQRIVVSKQSYYVISYCSDARAGDHKVVIEVKRTITDAEGSRREQAGRLSHRFSAQGFGGGCKPTIPPEWGGPPALPAEEPAEGQPAEGEPPAEGQPAEGQPPAAGQPPAPGQVPGGVPRAQP